MAKKNKQFLVDKKTIKEAGQKLAQKSRKKNFGKRFLICASILLCLCGLIFGLSRAGIIPLTITYLEDKGLLIEFITEKEAAADDPETEVPTAEEAPPAAGQSPSQAQQATTEPSSAGQGPSQAAPEAAPTQAQASGGQQTTGSDSGQPQFSDAQPSAPVPSGGLTSGVGLAGGSQANGGLASSGGLAGGSQANGGLASSGDQTRDGVLRLPDGLEIPLCPDGSHDHERRVFSGFTACYREDYEQPEWVAYTITPEKLIKEAERSNSFKADPQISTGSATPDDYKGSGYDRGHLAPAADMAYSEITMKESFFMSNMSPQAPSFNRGIWNNLENDVRSIAADCDCLYVITGPVLEKPASEYPSIGENKVSIPEFYYKVLLAVEEDEEGEPASVTSYAYLVPNGKTDEEPESFMCAIDDIEARTGIDFFSLLEDGLEKRLEEEIGATIGLR
ncbi:MAG: DNA/RNA non-specific endonuclease [Treponemataceae bacterium]|nr:DNA/RNA non-specific endonuclease [Treponemataceae bacterium]